MIFEVLTKKNLGEFIHYCQKHQEEVDESYLEKEELFNYDFTNNLTYVVREKDKIIGVSSLMLSNFYKKGKKARFRIFHCETDSLEIYKRLFQLILNEIKDIEKLFIFVHNGTMEKILEGLGFIIERYSYFLVKESPIIPSQFPRDYHLKPFEFGKDEATWCDVINASFKHLKGHVSDITTDMVQKFQTEVGHIDGGMLLLCHLDKVIGLVCITKEEYQNKSYAFIGPLAIIPDYQNKGLGSNLLRYSLEFGREHRLNQSLLTVNAENELAISLYLREGFIKEEVVVCYNYII